MPWRNLINDQLNTCETTDMSPEKLSDMQAQGWRECSLLELHLAQLVLSYGAEAVNAALKRLIDHKD